MEMIWMDEKFHNKMVVETLEDMEAPEEMVESVREFIHNYCNQRIADSFEMVPESEIEKLGNQVKETADSV